MARNMKLSPPWEEIHSMLQKFFESDKEVAVDAEIGDDMILGIACFNEKKFNALNEVLRKEYEFGNVILNVEAYFPSDAEPEVSIDTKKALTEANDISDEAKSMKAVLEGNELFDKIVIRNIMSSKMCYCLFKKEVVQFYNDDLTDLYGYESILAEDIARIIFSTQDVNFCTEVDQK